MALSFLVALLRANGGKHRLSQQTELGLRPSSATQFWREAPGRVVLLCLSIPIPCLSK